MPSRYEFPVDPEAANNAHAFALDLVGWNRRVLELGAAAGHVTRALVAQDCSVTAIEYERDAARDLEGVADEVIVADLNERVALEDLQPEFDVVLAGDVLEHLMRPQDVLSRVVRLLKPGGQVVVSLPHVAHADVRLALMQGRWDYRAWGLMDETHTRFFTLDAIKSLVSNAGLVITELRRVRVPAFETELGVDRRSVSTELLDAILADPEAETYQFVFSATPDNGDHRLRRLTERNTELEREVQRLVVENSALNDASTDEQEVLELRATIAQDRRELQELHVAVSRDHGELEELRAAVARDQPKLEELGRIEASVVWRLFTRVRTPLFALLGGERSPGVRLVQAIIRLLGRGLGLR